MAKQHKIRMSLGLLVVALSSAWSFAAKTTPSPVHVQMFDKDNAVIGTATLIQRTEGVKIELKMHHLPPGKHAVHIHEKGDCVAPTFETAGEHLALKKQHHGTQAAHGPHLGDLPNIEVDANGNLITEIMSERITLKKGPRSVLKKGGTSLVIHENADDHKSQPSGNSGARIACGVIKID